MWHQRVIELRARSKGFHLITDEIVDQLPELNELRVGLLHLFIQHTSASLSINEDADPSVRSDMEAHFLRAVPETAPYYEHTTEGPDDMPAHIRSVMLGESLTIPITNGRLTLGTWQGIYLGEHRIRGGSRQVVATLNGE